MTFLCFFWIEKIGLPIKEICSCNIASHDGMECRSDGVFYIFQELQGCSKPLQEGGRHGQLGKCEGRSGGLCTHGPMG